MVNESGESVKSSAVPLAYLNILLSMLVTISLLVIIAGAGVFVYFIGYRFYKSCYTDEGYLTFTLPENPGVILLSKFICGIVWVICAIVCVILDLLFIAFMASSGTGNSEFLPYIFSLINRSLSNRFGIISVFTVIQFILLFITVAAAQLLLMYLGISLGCMITKKNKLLLSIVMYFVVSSVAGWITGIVSTVLTVFSVISESTVFLTSLMMIIGFIIYAALGVGAFFICRNIMKNKLNLE